MNDLNAEELQQQPARLLAQYGADSPAARESNRARLRFFLNDVVAYLHGYRDQLLSFERLSEVAVKGEPVASMLGDKRSWGHLPVCQSQTTVLYPIFTLYG